MLCTISAKPNASNRTKNRLRENGNVMDKQRGPEKVNFANGEWILFRAANGWYGWLPADEIVIKED